MSKVYVYCYCNDGNWYRNPVWRGSHEGRAWFLCLDDDDPPELVVQLTNTWLANRQEYGLSMVDAYPQLDFFTSTCKASRMHYRCFKPVWDIHRMDMASARFGKLCKVPPPPTEFSAKFQYRPDDEGVWYDERFGMDEVCPACGATRLFRFEDHHGHIQLGEFYVDGGIHICKKGGE